MLFDSQNNLIAPVRCLPAAWRESHAQRLCSGITFLRKFHDERFLVGFARLKPDIHDGVSPARPQRVADAKVTRLPVHIPTATRDPAKTQVSAGEAVWCLGRSSPPRAKPMACTWIELEELTSSISTRTKLPWFQAAERPRSAAATAPVSDEFPETDKAAAVCCSR